MEWIQDGEHRHRWATDMHLPGFFFFFDFIIILYPQFGVRYILTTSCSSDFYCSSCDSYPLSPSHTVSLRRFGSIYLQFLFAIPRMPKNVHFGPLELSVPSAPH
jgi:hypothetical protein